MFFKQMACAALLFLVSFPASGETLRIGGFLPLTVLDLPIATGVAAGTFKARGLDVRYDQVGTVADLSGLLKRGDADVITLITPLGTMPDEIVVFRAHVRHTPFYLIGHPSLAEKGATRISPERLLGQTIPLSACEGAGSFTLFIFERWAQRVLPGVKTRCGEEEKGFSGIQFIPVSNVPAQRMLFDRGEVRVFNALFPAQIEYFKKGALLIAGPSDLPQVPAGVLIVRKDRISQLLPSLEKLWEGMQNEMDRLEATPERGVPFVKSRYRDMQDAEALRIVRLMLAERYWSRSGKRTLPEATEIAGFYQRQVKEGIITFKGKEIPVKEVFAPMIE